MHPISFYYIHEKGVNMAKRKDKQPIKCVVGYLQEIKDMNKSFREDDTIIVYRGEPAVYSTPGKPGIFREEYLAKDKYFEKNILLELKANKLTRGKNYLEMAIDSQHGGFPSRLLDVTYNCLIALYFACVSRPENELKENEKNGAVLIYKMNKAYCPTAGNALKNYEKLVEKPDCYLNHHLFSYNHKLVDHIKLNPRIIAQQGGLILFQGLEFSPIPNWMTKKIEIDKDFKDVIAEELEKFFGISTSFVYPEIDYAVDRIKTRAKSIDSAEVSLQNEINLCIRNEISNVDYELSQLLLLEKDKQQTKIVELEQRIHVLQQDLKDVIREAENVKDVSVDKSRIKNDYENLVCNYVKSFKSMMSKGFEPSFTELLWEN